MERVFRIDRVDQARALLFPIRARILQLLRRPAPAASLARGLGQTAPKIHYHLRELERLDLIRQVGRKRRGTRAETLFAARARSFYVPQEIYLLAAREADPPTDDPGGVVALEARVALKTAGERRSFAQDWRKLVEKYAPRDDGSCRDKLFEAIALCVPATVDPLPRGRSGQRSGSRTKGEQVA